MKVGILALAAVIGVSVTFGVPRLTEETVVATVTNTMVKNDLYLVYTDKETYKVEDTLAYFNYRSSDVWGKLAKGNTYEFTTTYWRVPWFSMFENIVEVKEVK
ncbi:hypothetical protein SIPHO037v1_p0113 [Vibrio phage 70E35.2]|nr:hypothetical protein SIPHO037v1_p0113 [Vibrio phage 70E35.2]